MFDYTNARSLKKDDLGRHYLTDRSTLSFNPNIHMKCIMRKPAFCICQKQRHRLAVVLGRLIRYLVCHWLNSVIFLVFTVKFLNFQTSKNFAVIYLKFKQRAKTFGYFVKKMQMK